MSLYLPWVRTGLAGAVTGADPLSGPLPSRASLPVGVTVGTAPEDSGSVTVDVHGPGDVTALDARAIVRTEPADGAQEAEPHLFCSIEFAVPDLPWLFTPAAPNGDRLRPWIVLVVVAEDAADLEPGDGTRPAVLQVSDARAELPDLAQSHAWAHAQVEALSDLTTPAERPISRLVCPRLLRSHTRYIAAVVPAFEAGRRAGLGLAVPASATTAAAWDSALAEPATLPAFHAWRFRTGADGDFESLATRLHRAPLGTDAASGRAVTVAGLPGGLPNLPGWRFPGALGSCPDPLPDSTFRTRMTEIVDGVRTLPGVPVPPPFYGRWHALERRLDATTRPWLSRLNLDPRYRAAAAVGARLVREHQEPLMAAAWQQIGEVEAANALLRQGQVARRAGTVLHETLARLDDETYLQATGPLHARVLDPDTGRTVAADVGGTRVPAALLSPALRRAIRPRGPLGRRSGTSAAELLRQVNDGLPVVAPRPAPDGMVTIDAEAEPGDPTWCALTPPVVAQLARARPPGMPAKEWDAVLAAALAQQEGMPPCPPREAPRPRPRLPVAHLRDVLSAATRPEVTVTARMAARIGAPPGWAPADPLTPILAAPRIDTPLSRDLLALAPDLVLPGLDGLPAEGVAAVPANQRFVESLMIGANHEFGRELLWRGYPTDQRGTSLRRFWDRAATLSGARDDLPAIDQTWTGELGTHLLGGRGPVVLVIRGELLRRYPRVVVYATRATWSGTARVPVDPLAGADPTATAYPQRHPAFSGLIPPDLRYVGFDLPDDVLGDPDPAAGRAGWFFVLQQPWAEVRLGLDATAADPPVGGAADLSWPAVGRTPSGHVDLGLPLTGVTLPGWGRGASSAQLAAWCEQRPFRVCIHASDLMHPEDLA